jgi:GDPmannose 4,6-dehydratase
VTTNTVCIVGSEGQDGTLLKEFLRAQGYNLLCIDRGIVHSEGFDWKRPIDITKPDEVVDAVRMLQPSQIYHLAAFHHSSQEAATETLEFFRASYEVNFFSLLHFLEAIRLHSPSSRLFYAASSHIFGQPSSDVQNEETPFSPQSAYAMTKVDGLLACRQYRAAYRVFASVGILYNHESRYRSDAFLTKKVIRTVVAIQRGESQKLVVGDLHATVDWGYAPDYVEAMCAILAAAEPDEFVIASGTKHTVLDFIDIAFHEAGLDWRLYVTENPGVMERRSQTRVGDSSKLTRLTGWKPKTGFRDMIRTLLHDESQTGGSTR